MDVEILTVTAAADAPAGDCDGSNFVSFHDRMIVGRTLARGGSTPFSGAAIGFTDKITNQDACENAKVRLLYTAVSV